VVGDFFLHELLELPLITLTKIIRVIRQNS